MKSMTDKQCVILISVISATVVILGVAIAAIILSSNITAPSSETKVTDIRITNSNIKTTTETGEKYITLFPDANGERKFQIEYTVSPNNATNKSVNFYIADKCDYASVDENGLVIFSDIKSPRSVLVYVTTTDGTRLYDTVEITFLK